MEQATKDRATVLTRVDPDVKRRLRVEAAHRGKSMSDVAAEIITDGVSRLEAEREMESQAA